MKSSLVLFTTYELLLALIFGLLTIYLSVRVLNKFIIKVDFFKLIREGNIAIAIFEGTLIVCALLLVENSILPAVDALRTMVLANDGFTFKMFLISFGYFLLFYVISLAFSLIILSISFYVFIKATADVDEMAEIKNNNIAVSILVSFVMIGVTMFIRPSFDNFIASLVNYNKLENVISTPSNDIELEEGMEMPEERAIPPK